jgi:hypothetical protein
MNSGFAERIRYVANRAKPYVGLSLLTVIILWVLREGYPIEKLSFALITSTLLAAMASGFANAMIISEISKVYGGAMNYKSSLYTTALGTFANAAGGIPIGTALKYILLHKKGRLSVAQTTAGFVVFTIFISLALLIYVAILIHWIDINDAYRNMAVLVLIISLVVLASAVFCLKYFPRIQRHFSPFLKFRSVLRVSVISIVVTLGFILNFWVVACQLFPQMTFIQTAFSVSLGSLVSQMAFLQSVGGVQELSIGVATRVAGTELIQGVMLGLTIRITALVSSGLIIAAFVLPSGKNTVRQPL